jgi:hypothetical protein
MSIYSINPKSKKLLRLIIKNNSPFMPNINTVSTSYPSLPKPQLYLQTFDTETEQGSEIPIKSKLLDLEGTSQLILDNTIYICGMNISSSTVSGDEFTSSFLYSVNILSEPLLINFEVNACYPHYFPTLALLRNEYIIVIGGLNTKKCEYYSITSKLWKDLPILPELRYGANAVSDNCNNHIYVFGGLNQQTRKCSMSVFKLNMNLCLKWETVVVMENADLLTKMCACVVKKEGGHIWIMGGEDEQGVPSDVIVDINLKDKVFKPKLLKKSLAKKTRFLSLRSGVTNEMNGSVYAMDDSLESKYNIVYKIDESMSALIYIDDEIIHNKNSINKK